MNENSNMIDERIDCGQFCLAQVSGLAGEKIRWEQTVKDLESKMGFLVGDCLVAAAFLSYMGPFLSNYR